MNIFKVIKKETQNFASKTAIIDGNHSVSYRTLICYAEKIACSLKEKGVHPFHRVGLLCDNSIDYICASLAVLSCSAVIVPVSQEHTEKEINHILDEMNITFFLFRKKFYNHKKTEISLLDGFLKNDFFIRRIQPDKEISDKYYKINPAYIRFSSGTTGKSKGVVLSHETVIERTDAANKALCITHEDIVLWVLSMSFHFVVSILLFLRRAATIVLCNSLITDTLVEGITKYQGTVIYASPLHYDLLIHSDLLLAESLTNIRLAISTTMKLPEGIANVFFTKFGIRLAEAYGIIEVGLPFVNFSVNRNHIGSAGRKLPDYEIEIVKQDINGIGNIYLKGKGMVDAYFSPWQNKEDILENGWFKTEDLGMLDQAGFLIIVGRNKDVINFAGIKIFPIEVEAVINQYPFIKESFVFGETHSQYGQLPIAKIVFKNQDNNFLHIHSLRRFCYERLAQYKVPKDFICVKQLSKTVNGKIKR